jgi:hypothetical protein
MYKRTLKTLIVALAIFAVIPVANAAAKPVSSSPPPASPIVSEKLAGLTTGAVDTPLVSEKLAGLTSTGIHQSAPLVSEKVGGLGLQSQPQTTVSVSNGSEFDWGDAGIGAGVVSAALIAAMAAMLAVRSKSRQGRLAH